MQTGPNATPRLLDDFLARYARPNAVGQVKVSAGIEATLHMESETPLQIGTPGTPASVAAPTINLFQQDLIGLRAVIDVAWALRQNFIAVVNNVAWGGS